MVTLLAKPRARQFRHGLWIVRGQGAVGVGLTLEAAFALWEDRYLFRHCVQPRAPLVWGKATTYQGALTRFAAWLAGR